jgi:hypothetical protein
MISPAAFSPLQRTAMMSAAQHSTAWVWRQAEKEQGGVGGDIGMLHSAMAQTGKCSAVVSR